MSRAELVQLAGAGFEDIGAMDAQAPFRELLYPYDNTRGERFWFRVSGQPVFGPDGKFRGYRGIGSDVTERVRLRAARDRLAAQIAKSPQALAVYAACAQTGVIFLPLNTAYTPAEVSYFLENSGAKLFLCDGKDAKALAPVSQKTGARQDTLNADGTGSFPDLAAAHPDAFETVARDKDDLAAFLYTSGTTGRSKGAMLTQDNLLSNAQVLTGYWQFTDADVLLHALPIFHTHGLFVATNVCLAAGAQMVFYPGFDAEKIIKDMPRATTMMGVPTFYTRLLDRDDFTAEVAGNMRLFISGSAPLLAETHRAFEARTGHRILERYGMTETNMNTSNPYDGERRPGTVGFPLPGVELRVCDDTGAELPQGEIGTIEVRGPNVFKGYWRMPEKTAEELRDTGFFITGDLGLVDVDGYVTIVGRGKDLIISGGYNIYPKEIELVLDQAPGVMESAVIGVPHPDFGETPVGVLARRPGETPDTDAIMTSLGDALARFKHPRKLVVVDALPRNTMGKVQKNVLRDQYKGSFAQE
jgi:malonyl-CoA/methylmalonyl-CoA synthetase